MTSGRREGRREGGRCPIVLIHKLCVDQPRVYHTTSCIDAVFRMLQSQVLGQDITRRTSRFFVGHGPPSRLPSRLPDVTHVTLSPRPSPPFLYCKRSKLEPGTAWERGYARAETEQGPHGTGGSRRRSTCEKYRPRAEMEQKPSKRDRARERRRKQRDTASEESKAKEKESDRYSHDTTLTS